MKENEILKIYGTDYKEMTKLLLTEAELESRIPAKNARIGIKPNLVAPRRLSWGATTHPGDRGRYHRIPFRREVLHSFFVGRLLGWG